MPFTVLYRRDMPLGAYPPMFIQYIFYHTPTAFTTFYAKYSVYSCAKSPLSPQVRPPLSALPITERAPCPAPVGAGVPDAVE